MSKHVEELRAKYLANPPEGMSADDIKKMPANALLDMDYFFNDDEFGEEAFYLLLLSSSYCVCFSADIFIFNSSERKNFLIC